ncbi:MAG: HpcH/HpaI aldolase/citrate lyase family protein [Candidatus Acidiferrales bacterium]
MIRSMLYVPASSERFISRAHERGADAIILDLEDSVVPEEKEKARSGLSEAVRSVRRTGATVFVRVNSLEDLILADAEAACRAGAFGLLVPKVNDPGTLTRLEKLLEAIEGEIARREKTVLVPLIEDPGAVFDARAIAGATPRVFGVMTGGEDLCTVMGADPIPEVVRFPTLLVHLAAKAAGVLSFGLLRSVADYRDLEGITRAAREARTFGFDGASCVHPQVVPILNEAFSPSAEEIARAARLIAAYDAAQTAGKGACVFEGKMIDVPVVQRARALLARQSGR